MTELNIRKLRRDLHDSYKALKEFTATDHFPMQKIIEMHRNLETTISAILYETSTELLTDEETSYLKNYMTDEQPF